jgi:hypothetical protein
MRHFTQHAAYRITVWFGINRAPERATDAVGLRVVSARVLATYPGSVVIQSSRETSRTNPARRAVWDRRETSYGTLVIA